MKEKEITMIYTGFTQLLGHKIIYLIYYNDNLIYRSKAGTVNKPNPPMIYKKAGIKAQKEFLNKYLNEICFYESIATLNEDYIFILTRKQNEWTYPTAYERNKKLLLELKE